MKIKTAGDLFTASAKGWGGGGVKYTEKRKYSFIFLPEDRLPNLVCLSPKYVVTLIYT